MAFLPGAGGWHAPAAWGRGGALDCSNRGEKKVLITTITVSKDYPVSEGSEYYLQRTHCVPDVTLTYKMSLSNSLWHGGVILLTTITWESETVGTDKISYSRSSSW